MSTRPAIRFIIGGQEVPCRVTMGALLDYKQRTGRDVSQLKGDDIAGIVTLILCCVESTCRADGITLEGVDMTHLADYIDLGAVMQMIEALEEDASGNAPRPAESR